MGMLRLLFLTAAFAVVNCQSPLNLAFEWTFMDYDFPNASMREALESSGDFIQKNTFPTGVSIWKDKMFITVPRWRKGVASNLNVISLKDNLGKNKSPKLTPYPSWELNDIHSPDAIVNMFRTRVDACGRLWGVDMGVEDILGNFKIVKPAHLVIIDLKTDKIIRSYPLTHTDMKPMSFIADLTVDVDKDDCENGHAYLTDFGGYGLVVYSFAENKSWRFDHNYFHFDPLHGDFNVSGINFHWTDGVFGSTLSPKMKDGKDRYLYFHAMAGITEFAVLTSVLKNEKNAHMDNYHMFNVLGEKGPMTQGGSSTTDLDTGIVYFTQANNHGIACWPSFKTLNPTTFKLLATDEEKLAFPNDITVDQENKTLYTLMSNVAKIQRDKIDETNKYYIFSASLDVLHQMCLAEAVELDC